MAEEVTSQKWNRVIFNFGTGESEWEVRGVLRSLRRMARAIFASLPIETEALSFDGREVLIRLDESLRGEFSKEDRIHRAEEGSIIYRPQLPALSLYSEYREIYEPVEKLGEIQRDSLESLQKVCSESALLYVEMVSGEEE
ncbi:MAG: hypothetical protein GWO20_19910 [Candidatus Korarchaeota archaeon]|nr:hypothetical protein [Candidatus Korarchaeota archaeon]NIU85498.1 hypothetical protein [Candidatus Thorarchaeota archaeon]NIW15615.1 hypothetical protein [Candidatus Thorarchaeota archaeon]NIW53546.1 hypothetical protein [Candidatus Korarchaeota archaeon]